ncbi:MFS transporter [Streptosporangium sp. NPDC004379]|uniref:MFS transporter n=1 Tax=Streptosporangium sp. NPDC004379 TaxID=3366189 RepID=UPI0036BB3C0B
MSLQHVLGYGPLQTGLAFLPHTLLTMLVGLRLTPWLMRRADDRVLIVAGALIGAAGFWWQSRIAPGQDYLTAIAGPAVLISLGGGLLNTPLTVTVTSGVAAADAGAASGLMNTAKQIGGALGLASLVALTAGQDGERAGPAGRRSWRLATGRPSPPSPWCWPPSPSWRPRCRDGATPARCHPGKAGGWRPER